MDIIMSTVLYNVTPCSVVEYPEDWGSTYFQILVNIYQWHYVQSHKPVSCKLSWVYKHWFLDIMKDMRMGGE
jgi:hypothetical protein